MLYGIIIVSFIALMGVIGVFSDTAQRGGLKWFLTILILAGAGAGGWWEHLRDHEDKKEKQKLVDALELAKSSNKLAKDSLKSHETDVLEFAKKREQMESSLRNTESAAAKLIGQISTMSKQLQEIEKALTKGKPKKNELGDTVSKMRIDASKKVVSIAKDAQWMEPPEIAKLEAWFKEELPLKTQHFNAIQNALKNK